LNRGESIAEQAAVLQTKATPPISDSKKVDSKLVDYMSGSSSESEVAPVIKQVKSIH
jgi:hypothetical protein